ncbi:hypothetical protein [Mycobacterium paragordonae]|uniref:Uncharacterized protein n=1 Tax=Mycobacterium paragordonae TaxID=1389713 RepID=A0AAJ1S882_9MYCO|nr:hypothetical protein [Mycobacterium paragordonae]MDP7739376.1 hypothetical protein [Mycobacterium paragordonae]
MKRIVADWIDANDEPTIAWLAQHPVEPSRYSLSAAEAETIGVVAQRMRDFAVSEGMEDPVVEDGVCKLWADRYEPFDLAPRLDPVVGSVSGIGLALWSYMRMRSGADAIKIDVRVKRAMRASGFHVPNDDYAAHVIAKAAAAEINVSLLVLDQLLWTLDS